MLANISTYTGCLFMFVTQDAFDNTKVASVEEINMLLACSHLCLKGVKLVYGCAGIHTYSHTHMNTNTYV